MSNINTLKIHTLESNKISDEEILLMPIEDRLKLYLNCDERIAYDDKKRKIFGLSEKAPGKSVPGDSIVVESYEYPVKFQAYENSERIYDESLVIEVLGVLDGVSVPGFIRELCKDTYYIFSKVENLEIDQLGSAIVNLAVREALIELKKQTLGNLHNGEKPATILTADDEFPIICDQFMNLLYYKIRKISFETITGGRVDDNSDFTRDKFFISGFIDWAEKNKERLEDAGYNIENVIRECEQYYGPISILLFPMVAKGLDIGIYIKGYDSYNRHFLFVDGDITAVLGKKITNNTSVERLEDIYTEVVYGGKVLENLDYYTSILIGFLKQDVSILDVHRLKDSVYTFFYLLKHAFGIVPVVSCSPIKVGSTRSQDLHEKRLVYQQNIYLSLFSDGLRYMQKNLSPLHHILIETILFSKKQNSVEEYAFTNIKVEILNLIENLKKNSIIDAVEFGSLKEMFLSFEKDENIFELFNLIFALNKIAFINGQNTKKTERNTLDDATLLIREGNLSNERFSTPLTDMQDIVEFDPFGNRLANFFVELAIHHFTDTNEIIDFFVRKIVIPYVLTTSGAIQNWGSISEDKKNEILKYYAGWLIDPETKQIRPTEEIIRIVGRDYPTKILMDFRSGIDNDF